MLQHALHNLRSHNFRLVAEEESENQESRDIVSRITKRTKNSDALSESWQSYQNDFCLMYAMSLYPIIKFHGVTPLTVISTHKWYVGIRGNN